MFHTRTGNFPIGFRIGWSDWQKNLDGAASWAKGSGFSFIDLGANADSTGQKILDAGLKIGSADLREWKSLITADKAKRNAALADNSAFIEKCAALGVRNFFIAMMPESPDQPRSENFSLMIESMGMLAPTLEKNHATMVIEGWPGPGVLCCTPEAFRALFEKISSRAIGINYDPSHLMRMGIDPIRFLEEFAVRVHHVHGKDTELLDDHRYEYGTEQAPTFGKPAAFGGMHWRYTIPGHGQFRWTRCFEILKERGYNGGVSIELEDMNFNGSEQSEKNGLLFGARFLEGC